MLAEKFILVLEARLRAQEFLQGHAGSRFMSADGRVGKPPQETTSTNN